MAWWHATPSDCKEDRLTQFISQNPEGTSPPFPPVESGKYLIRIAQEVGLFQNNGMGIVPTSWQEIKAWADLTGTELSNWELETIKALSNSYTGELNAAKDKLRPAPYDVAPELSREEVAQKVVNIFSGFKKIKG